MASQAELYNAALGQGLSPEKAKIAAAIGMGESGGNLNAHNANAATGDDSYGAWQINMLGALGPARRAQLGLQSNEELYDLTTNARAMRMISSSGTNFEPWSVYKSGKYKEFLDSPVSEGDGKNWAEKVGGAIIPDNPLSGLVATVNKTAKWVSNSENWLRVGYVTGGSILVVAGLVMVLQSTSAGRAVTNVVPVGKVANIARSAVKSKPKVARVGPTARPGTARYDPK